MVSFSCLLFIPVFPFLPISRLFEHVLVLHFIFFFFITSPWILSIVTSVGLTIYTRNLQWSCN